MKKSLLIGVMVTLPLSTSLAWADAHNSDKDKKPATTMTDKDTQMQMGKMQEHMLSMHAQLHKIMDAKNPQEREQLMQEHSKMMQDHMQVMQGRMDGGMMGKGKTGGDAKGGRMDGGMKDM
ncbi:hypothetical protein Q6D67_08010 [Haliea sp. E1-2-M8]|uniref:hypothetical protein n=1 Tax=Haliea sp. E1-2-M8 TaxID=3064706 RepID=UPI0027284AF9|nr:hypothetical protein [Haliea sp. E1-2-M8]MDO8861644.1 hypothetical protein [Haliea sp. E1-2-M8]